MIQIFLKGGSHGDSSDSAVLCVLRFSANSAGGLGYRSDSSSPSAEKIRLVATFCVQTNKNELNKVARDFLLVYPQKYLIASLPRRCEAFLRGPF